MCFAFVKKLQYIDFGLVLLQSVSDIFGALFYLFHVLEGYIMRYLFYCEDEWAVIKSICTKQLIQMNSGDTKKKKKSILFEIKKSYILHFKQSLPGQKNLHRV